ncbi:MAG: IS21 family transposase [Bdellovibrionales bacterium]|nr:IS21 family transposase [Bdellovibrionales bacterium]
MDRKIVERLRLGDGTNKISRDLKVSKKRVIEVRKLASKRGYLSSDSALPAYPEVLFPEHKDGRAERSSKVNDELVTHKDLIENQLKEGWDPITIFEELPIKVTRSSFYRFLARHKLTSNNSLRVVPEIVTQPGESLQLDWGKLCTVTEDGNKKTVWMLAGVLGFSRYRMVRLVWSNDVESTIAAIKSMFDELGGVPAKVTTDNPKCFAIKAGKFETQFNPVMERFASHYGFVIECLPPREPQQKGKVERQIKYIRRLYQAHADWWTLEESQHYLNEKLIKANALKHGTTRLVPKVVFEDTEQSALNTLPSTPYEVEQYHCGRVRRDGHVRFRGKYYSVDSKFIGREVVIIGTSSQVSIFLEGKLLEVHNRVTDPHLSKSTKESHLKPWEQSLENSSVYRKRAQKIGPWVDEMIATILASGNGFVDFRKIWGILSLEKSYPAHYIDKACELACSLDRYGYYPVKELTEKLIDQDNYSDISEDNQKQAVAGSHKFVHPIAEYKKQLTLIQGGKVNE